MIQTGIYSIYCSSNKKHYVGSSNNIQRRWLEHQSKLRRNIHPNLYLQRAWKKYGEDKFIFSILELCNKIDLNNKEKCWISKLKSFIRVNGFNIDENPRITKVTQKYIVTFPDGREEIISNLKEFEETHNIKGSGLYQVARGLTNQCYGFKARPVNLTKEEWQKTVIRPSKHGPGHKGEWLITFPNGVQEKIFSLTAFCIKHDLSQGNMAQIARGNSTRKQHKGFKCIKL